MQYYILTARSLRHLKPVQVWARISKYARSKIRGDAYYRRLQNSWTETVEISPLIVSSISKEAESSHDFCTNTFSFLNRTACLGEPMDWFPKGETQLWHYNLHYFHYVADLAALYTHAVAQNDERRAQHVYQTFRRLVREWLTNCPIATPVAWDPYPISLRISNWMKAYTWFAAALQNDPEFAKGLQKTIYIQTLHLENNLEYHLLGNHLIENGRALALAGLFFANTTAERWYEKGTRILYDELKEQVLEDGGHYERSPMYHIVMLELYQETFAILTAHGRQVPAWALARVQKMHSWLRALLHPDGQIPLLNDAAFNMTDTPSALIDVETPAAHGLSALPNSGYFTFRDNAKQNFLIFDCGPLGPEYQPGHGHCDTLSYELSLNKKRFVVDAGVGSYYGDLDWRMYYRSTRAHNTVVVDDQEQSEVWHRFRVARRAYPTNVQWNNEPTFSYVTGSHTGYHRLAGKVRHKRWICWIDQRFWLICDYISGKGYHNTESLLHFHPAVEIAEPPVYRDGYVAGSVAREQDRLRVDAWGVNAVSRYHGETVPIQGWYAPEFGLQHQNEVWGLHCNGTLPLWFGYVLLPSAEELTIRPSRLDEETQQLTVQLGSQTYRITCGAKITSLEKMS